MKALIAVVAVAAVTVVVAAAFVFTRGEHTGPDAFAGAYPLVTPGPTESPPPTWHPTGSPAGPLPVFKGAGSKVVGRVIDRGSGVSYAKFAPPWRRPRILSSGHTGAEEISAKNATGLENFWYVAVYSGPLDAKLAAGATGPEAMRAAAELVGQDWVHEFYSDEGKRTELAGQPLTIDGRRAWLSAFRMTHTDSTPRAEKSQTEVIVAIDTGRRVPAIVTITVPSNKNQFLPNINIVVRSLHVVR